LRVIFRLQIYWQKPEADYNPADAELESRLRSLGYIE